MSGRANAGERRTVTGVPYPAKSIISFKITSFRFRTPCLSVSHISSSTLRRIALLSDFPTVGAGFNAFHQTTDGGETGTGSQKKTPKLISKNIRAAWSPILQRTVSKSVWIYVQGWPKRWTPGYVNMRRKNCALLPAAGRK